MKQIPAPKYEAEWWKSQLLVNPIGFDYVMCNEEIKPEKGNWVLYGNYASEPFAPAGGYRVLFPSSLDLLLWMRWMYLPSLCDDSDLRTGAEVVLFGKAAEFADKIDTVLGMPKSRKILGDITDEVIALDYGKELEIYSISEVE